MYVLWLILVTATLACFLQPSWMQSMLHIDSDKRTVNTYGVGIFLAGFSFEMWLIGFPLVAKIVTAVILTLAVYAYRKDWHHVLLPDRR